MGMLSNKELAEALITNLASWDWSINSKFSVDEATGRALIETYKALKAETTKTIHQRLDDIAGDICDNYCKYPQVVHEKYLRGEISEACDKSDYLQDYYCNHCPLMEKI